MPFKSRLIQAIRDEEAKLRTERAIHVAGPGIVLIAFIAIAGWLAVRVIRAPELFGGGAFDVIGYGFLGVVVAGWLTKGRTFEQWLDRWLRLRNEHLARVAKIEAVMAKLARNEAEKAELVAGEPPTQPESDPWLRALAAPPKDATGKES